MLCPSCSHRRGRRACPALGQNICATCCGTKRLTEIQCPSTCGYLASAREHPAAVVRRQQERDVALLTPSLRGLTERQHQLFFLLQTLIIGHKPDGFARLVDDDVTEAAEVLASTFETAARGVIYEHAARSLPARHLATEMKTLIAEMRQQGAVVYDREIAMVLRAIAQGAREVRQAEGGDSQYLALMLRLLQHKASAEPAARQRPPASTLILP